MNYILKLYPQLYLKNKLYPVKQQQQQEKTKQRERIVWKSLLLRSYARFKIEVQTDRKVMSQISFN